VQETSLPTFYSPFGYEPRKATRPYTRSDYLDS